MVWPWSFWASPRCYYHTGMNEVNVWWFYMQNERSFQLCVFQISPPGDMLYTREPNPFLRKKNPFHVVFHIFQQQLEKYNRVYICAASSKAGSMSSEQLWLCTLTNTTATSAKIIAMKQWYWIQKTGWHWGCMYRLEMNTDESERWIMGKLRWNV